MDFGLEGKIALVTGASKGLGFGIASELAHDGATVAISSRSEDRITAAAQKIGAHPFVHDTGDAGAAHGLVSRIEDELGPIDILVTNSGGPPASEDALSFGLEQWRSAYELLLLGPLALVQAAVPGMQERGWGRVVSVSSAVVKEPSPVLVLSSSHRAGLLAALKTIARQVAGDGVTINSLLTGGIATDRSRELGADKPERLAQIPARRLGTVEEFAAAAAFLCSERASYITGVALPVDGGSSRAV
jgi:3-oxoacyl-[acyl-carrier protein] reductase